MKQFSNLFQRFLLLMIVLSASLTGNAYDFSAKNSDGVIIYYNVLNETERTCEVTYAEQITSYDYSTISKDYEGAIVIPSSVIGYKVSQIGQGTFTCCRNMTSVSIPNSVTNIRRSAFNSCSGLTSITIPTSVITIEYGAFSGCTGLTTVTIPNSVTSLGDGVFYDCRGLTSITIPNSVTTMGRLVFSTCSNLTSIVIPKSVTSIGDNPFIHCNKLTKIVVEEGNLNYDSRNNCNAIINSKTNELIAGCNKTTLLNSITSIGNSAFYGLTGLKYIVIPNSVTSIGWGAFSDCRNLSYIEIPNSVNSIENAAFRNCSGLSSVTIPNSVTSIEIEAFSGCSGLTSIEIPSSVTSIGDYAFEGCTGLTFVVIPSSVTSIGWRAFLGCSGLTSITSYITDVFETGVGAFNACKNAKLYVPKGLVGKYQSTADWNSITHIEEIPGIDITMACNDFGKVLINGYMDFTNKVGEASLYNGGENTFVFTPNEGCMLKQVLINGLDVTRSVKDNKLTTTILDGSSMNVIFSEEGGDVNGDGVVNITDVVALVNIILGK